MKLAMSLGLLMITIASKKPDFITCASWFLLVFAGLSLCGLPLTAQAQTIIQIQAKSPPSPAKPQQNQDKVVPFYPPETVQQWVAKYKTNGWAKCRMSAIDTFGVTAGKASTEVFVAIRQLTEGMEEVEKLLEDSGVDNRTRKSALQAEYHLISVMTLEQKGALFRECVHSLW
jgi:hypothetical protein